MVEFPLLMQSAVRPLSGCYYDVVWATTATGTVALRRNSPSQFAFTTTFERRAMRADLRQVGLEEAIRALCDREVADLHLVVRLLANQLLTEVSHKGEGEGRVIRMCQLRDSQEQHTWNADNNTVVVVPPRICTLDTITCDKDMSEAAVVDATMDLILREKTESIRGVYQEILTDVRAR